MTDTKYKRRTFKEVAIAAYAKGWSEGREASHKALELENATLQHRLDNISLRKLAWSRITGLFKGGRHE